jgi:hypothetical protein
MEEKRYINLDGTDHIVDPACQATLCNVRTGHLDKSITTDAPQDGHTCKRCDDFAGLRMADNSFEAIIYLVILAEKRHGPVKDLKSQINTMISGDMCLEYNVRMAISPPIIDTELFEIEI